MGASAKADYGYYRAQYHNANATAVVAAADSATMSGVITAKSTRHSIFVQRVILSVITDAAQSLIFQDSANTPIIVAKSAASPGLGVEVVADFGPEGYQLTEGKNLDIAISSAGLAAKVSIEAYQRVTAVSATL